MRHWPFLWKAPKIVSESWKSWLTTCLQQRVTSSSNKQFQTLKTSCSCLTTTTSMNWASIGRNWKKKDLIQLSSTIRLSKDFRCTTILPMRIFSESLYRFRDSWKSFVTFKLMKRPISDILTLKAMLLNCTKLDYWKKCLIWTFFTTIHSATMKTSTWMKSLSLKLRLSNWEKSTSPKNQCHLMKPFRRRTKMDKHPITPMPSTKW